MFSALFELLTGNFLFFALHFDSRSVFPKPLSAKEERECFERMAQGDKAAKDKLIEHNLRLVAHIIKKYYSNSTDQEDLISLRQLRLTEKAIAQSDYLSFTLIKGAFDIAVELFTANGKLYFVGNVLSVCDYIYKAKLIAVLIGINRLVKVDIVGRLFLGAEVH